MQQVLGLTYESVLPEVLDQYLGTIFKPLRPLMLYGRDASQQPQCKPKEAVYWGWKDTVWGVGCGMWGVGCGVWGVGTRERKRIGRENEESGGKEGKRQRALSGRWLTMNL